MLNNSGVTKTTFGAPRQILADVQHQKSCGCIVPQSIGVTVGAKKIAKAGTPIHVDFMNLQNDVAAAAAGKNMNAVLLHDVDVTTGAGNGTALYFGTVNVNRVESDVASAIDTALALTEADAPSPLLVFGKF